MKGAACTSVGKHPRTLRGLDDATTDPATIEKWWRRWPDANVAIRTGNGLVVLDVDVGHDGDASLAELEAELGNLPATPRVNTGGGGWHFYLSAPGPVGCRIGVRPGVDVRGDGGYVVAPPSLHASGRRYEWAP